MQFQCAVQTHVGLRRKLNEDSLLDRTDIGLWAVADGMGGHEQGDRASAAIVEGLVKLTRQPTSQAMTEAAIRALETVNAAAEPNPRRL